MVNTSQELRQQVQSVSFFKKERVRGVWGDGVGVGGKAKMRVFWR